MGWMGGAVGDSWREKLLATAGGKTGKGEGVVVGWRGGNTVDSKERAPTCQMYLPNCKVTRQSERQRKRGRERERCGERDREREGGRGRDAGRE